MSNSKKQLLTTGEFAKLGATTKRTVQYYDKMEILKPHLVNEKGYRLYKPEQILDLQVILLLTTLGIPLKRIKDYLKNKDLRELFENRRNQIKKEIDFLEYSLDRISKYYKNLDKNNTLVDPKVKYVNEFQYYYIEKTGSYSEIETYCKDLAEMFSPKIKDPVTLTIFLNEGYSPKSSKFQIGLMKTWKSNSRIKVKDKFEEIVKLSSMEALKAVTYMHKGPGSTLSMMWQQVYKYMKINGLKQNYDIPEFEIYWVVGEKEYQNEFEIVVPVG